VLCEPDPVISVVEKYATWQDDGWLQVRDGI